MRTTSRIGRHVTSVGRIREMIRTCHRRFGRSRSGPAIGSAADVKHTTLPRVTCATSAIRIRLQRTACVRRWTTPRRQLTPTPCKHRCSTRPQLWADWLRIRTPWHTHHPPLSHFSFCSLFPHPTPVRSSILRSVIIHKKPPAVSSENNPFSFSHPLPSPFCLYIARDVILSLSARDRERYTVNELSTWKLLWQFQLREFPRFLPLSV